LKVWLGITLYMGIVVAILRLLEYSCNLGTALWADVPGDRNV
jgi:hypothetical protein